MAITKNQIRAGIDNGVVRFIVDPNMESGTVCEIGDIWFYFGGETAEQEEPKEFLKNANLEEVVESIYNTLEDFRVHDTFQDEYDYYSAVLEDSMCAE